MLLMRAKGARKKHRIALQTEDDVNYITDSGLVWKRPLFWASSGAAAISGGKLVRAYNPISQAEGALISIRELARKLDALEVRQHEQNTQIIALLRQLNRMLEPQPVPARGPIGFVANGREQFHRSRTLLKTEVGRYAGVVLQFADHGWDGSRSE